MTLPELAHQLDLSHRFVKGRIGDRLSQVMGLERLVDRPAPKEPLDLLVAAHGAD